MQPAFLLLALLGPPTPQAVDQAQLAALAAALAAPEEGALAALGPEHAEEAIALLAERRLPAEGDAVVLLSPSQDERLLSWLAALPPAQLRGTLAALYEDKAPFLAREVGVRVLERIGGGEDLVLLARLARPETGLEARRAEKAFEAARLAGEGREAPSFSTVLRAFDEAHPALLAGVLGALDACGENRLAALARLLGRRPDADGLVLAELERAAALEPAPHDARVSNEVERVAVGADPATSIAAIGVLEALDQTESVELLIHLLDHPVGGVGERARRALAALTGQRFACSTDWLAWLKAEDDWWWKSGERALARLSLATDAEFAALLGDVGRHRLFRHMIAPAVAAQAGMRSADLAAYASAVLGNLGSPSAVPALRALAVEHADPGVRRAAAAALARLEPRSRIASQGDRP